MSNPDAHTIKATVVPNSLRPTFLPTQLGIGLSVFAEATVFGWMDRLAPAYKGGCWDFVRLSNGGFFMYPIMSGPVSIEVESNGYRGEFSAEAAGIVACLFALCDLATGGSDRLMEQFHLLRDFALQHAEATSIFQATN